jgi:hypothetical protein
LISYVGAGFTPALALEYPFLYTPTTSTRRNH